MICLIVVTVPATLMGATFPLALRWLEPRPNEPAARAGQIAGLFYAVHTFGAALGAAVTGFLLLPALGLQRSTIVGVIVNTIVGGVRLRPPVASPRRRWARLDARRHIPTAPRRAVIDGHDSRFIVRRGHCHRPAKGLGHRLEDEAETASARSLRRTAARGERMVRARRIRRLAAVTLAISGFIALVHEVAWTRVIALTLGPTTYAFSTMLATCILGLAVGAALATRWLPRLRRPVTALAVTQIAAALGAFLAAALVPRLPAFVASLVASPHQFGWTLAIEVLLIAILLLPMTLAARRGVSVRGRHRRTGCRRHRARGVARLHREYARRDWRRADRRLRADSPVRPAAHDHVRGAAGRARRRRVDLAHAAARPLARAGCRLLGVLTAILGVSLPSWNTLQLTSGAYRIADGTLTDVPYGLEAGALLYYDDGAAGTVSVRRLAGTIALAINGTVDASNTRDMLRQTMLAHLPLLLHAAPSDVCIIGLGSGVTAGAALAHPVDRVDTIELSREVVRASDFFSTENRAALRDPRGHLLVGDGRTHLRLASRTYDVIISEPSSPWIAGAAPLFTRELFAAARDRLNPGGLFAQRVHLQGVPRADVRSILATFADVFPHTTLWLAGETDLLVIGSREALRPRVQELPRRWQVPGVAADFERVQVRDPFGLLMSFVADESVVAVDRRRRAGADGRSDDARVLGAVGIAGARRSGGVAARSAVA